MQSKEYLYTILSRSTYYPGVYTYYPGVLTIQEYLLSRSAYYPGVLTIQEYLLSEVAYLYIYNNII